jgi:hypothetical protein
MEMEWRGWESFNHLDNSGYIVIGSELAAFAR